MLRIYQSKNAAQAKSYFSSELAKGDYYFGDQEVVGQWRGKTAQLLGLAGTDVTQDIFNSLVDNEHPDTGKRLTARQRDDRTVGYDFTFNAPKALSLAYEFTQDERLLDAFHQAVRTTMETIESEMHARVRKKGKSEDRNTGNMVYAEFTHFTARPVEGHAPDPHLHAHVYAPNITFDAEENQYKAGQFRPIKTDAPYYEAMFHSHLAQSMSDMGIAVERDGKFWTMSDIEKETLQKFSNRTEEVEKMAREQNVTDPDRKADLGAKTRSKKEKGIFREALRDVWQKNLTDEESATFKNLFNGNQEDGRERNLTAEQAVDYALSHQLERQSVVPLARLKETALRFSVGQITPEKIEEEFDLREELMVTKKYGRDMATTVEVWQEEQDIIRFTKQGYAQHAKLNDDYEIGQVTDHVSGKQFDLGQEQKDVVSGLLKSRDRVMAVQGKAGTGKTTTLATLIDGIEQSGGETMVLAPSADAAYTTLVKDGEAYQSDTMKKAETLARYMVDERLWKKDAVLIVDEAGLMSVRDMHMLFALAIKNDNRVILVGDTAQHNSVMRGDAYRILQDEAQLEPLSLENIRRQDGEYKDAVKKIAKGDVVKGFDRLDGLGSIMEEEDSEARYRSLADSYTQAIKDSKTVLTVAPTHAEGRQVTEAIRNRLKEAGKLNSDEVAVKRFRNLQLSEAERSDHHNFQKGQMIRFQQNAKGVKRGEQFTVASVDKGTVWVLNDEGKKQALNLTENKRFNVYERKDIAFAKGDRLRITEGGTSKDGKRLNNGAIYTVEKVNAQGDIVLDNGRILDQEKGNFDHGYVTTSFTSQGKSIDKIFLAQSTENSGATNMEQFYVSVSRGKKSVSIYTDNKSELRQQIERSSQRLSASELFKTSPEPKDYFNGVSAAIRYMASKFKHYKDKQPREPSRDKTWQEKVRKSQQQDRDVSI